MSTTTESQAPDPMKEVETLLEADLAKEQASNRLTMQVGSGFVIFVAAYLVWISVSIGTLLDPSGLAHAATGYAIDAVPEAGKQVRLLVVDGAPDLARQGADQLVGLIPGYRALLQEEIDPVLDEVCGVLAEASVQELAQRAGEPASKYATDDALQAGADAAVARVDAILDESMQLEDDEGVTPKQHIEVALDQLKKVDKGLKVLARKGGDPAERELLLAWLNVIGQANEAEETALVADYKETAAAEKAARGETKPAGEAASAPGAPNAGATAATPADSPPPTPGQ